jgi:hypothetical protein
MEDLRAPGGESIPGGETGIEAESDRVNPFT